MGAQTWVLPLVMAQLIQEKYENSCQGHVFAHFKST